MLFWHGAGARNLLLTLLGIIGVFAAPAAITAGVRASTYAAYDSLAADVRFAVQKLQELNDASGPLRGALDLNQLGMGGHSGHTASPNLVLTTPESFKYEMGAQRGIEIGIAMGAAFFDCYLRGSKCVEDLAMFPEVKVEKTTRP